MCSPVVLLNMFVLPFAEVPSVVSFTATRHYSKQIINMDFTELIVTFLSFS